MTGSEQAIQQPPTEIGASFTISDLGTTDGGKAITAIRDAFEGCWEEKALVVELVAGGKGHAYSFQGDSPIFCCHVPEEAYDADTHHGPQTMGFRYSYNFMKDIETADKIRVVEWDDTRFTDVEEVVYP